MPRIQWVEEAEATGEVAEIYQAYREKNGRPHVAGLLKCLSLRPDFLKDVVDFSDHLLFSDGHLTRQTKELIATYVSSLNGCRYCAGSHAYRLQRMATEEPVIQALERGDLAAAPLSPELHALLAVAGTVAQHAYRTTDEEVQRLRDLGWTDPQIAEAIYITALFAFYNRVADAFGLEDPCLRQPAAS